MAHYLGGTLSDQETEDFLNSINKRAERKCIAYLPNGKECNALFQSEGYHNRRCPKCASRLLYHQSHIKIREPIIYRKRNNTFRDEIS